MNNNLLDEIFAHAIEEYPRECCGLVVAIGRKEKYLRCQNIADDGDNHFVMNPQDLASAEQQGTIKMIVHSHPDESSKPSDADRVACETHGLPWCIVAVHGDPATPEAPPVARGHAILTPSGFELPLRGRDYRFGVADCYSIVRDYYNREMGIDLPDFHREDKFWERGEDLIMQHLSENGFTPISKPSQKGDLILMSIKSDVVNHLGVWLGERDAMLHHPYGHLSEKTVYGGYWLENMRLYARKTQ